MGIVDIKSTKHKVLYLLETEPHLRDSDEKLVSNIWYQELKAMKLDPKSISAMQLLKIIADGLVTNPESIRRCRQGFQNSTPELRGKKYLDRMNKQEDVKDDLDNLHKKTK